MKPKGMRIKREYAEAIDALGVLKYPLIKGSVLKTDLTESTSFNSLSFAPQLLV